MPTEEYLDLLKKLVAKTEAGAVNWHPTSNDNEFVVYFDQFSLSMYMSREEREEDSCTFTIRDSTGKTVDRFWLQESEANWSLVDRLFTAARRKALRVDEAVGAILRELDSKKSVGLAEAPTKPADDDDIPF